MGLPCGALSALSLLYEISQVVADHLATGTCMRDLRRVIIPMGPRETLVVAVPFRTELAPNSHGAFGRKNAPTLRRGQTLIVPRC